MGRRELLIDAWPPAGLLDEAGAWIEAQVRVTGPIEPYDRHVKPWSVTLRVPAADGPLWFKEVCPALDFEPGLTAGLAKQMPGFVPDVVAVDGPRMLARDAGPRLDSLSDPRSPRWLDVVARYAELQIAVAPVAGALPAPDHRPEELRAQFDRAGPLVDSLGTTVPYSIVHLALHNRHVCFGDGQPVLVDWGAACFAHPFCGLVETFHVLVHRLGLTPGAPELLRVRDAYLEPWTEFAAAGELRRIFEPANALGALCRVVAWEQKLAHLSPAAREPYSQKPAKGLRSFAAALAYPGAFGGFADAI